MASRALRRRSTYRALNGHRKDKPRPFLRMGLVLLVGFMMLTSGASAATLFFYGTDLPSLKGFNHRVQFQDTIIRDRYGQPLYDMADLSQADKGRRVVEPLIDPSHGTAYFRNHGQYWLTGTDRLPGKTAAEGVPVVLQDATIATEDASFYDNPGFDPMSILRAGFDNLTTGHVVSGASTITQQLIKRFLLNANNKTLSRKLEEIVLAMELTQKYPKSKILWYYLNSISYGNLSIGAEAAARTYFGTDVWNLDLAQSAMLAGIPEAPAIYDPVTNLPAAKGRMRYVLYLMWKHGYLKDARGRPDASLIDKAMAESSRWKFKPVATPKRFPHFVQYVITWLQDQFPDKVYKGLDVTTTIDPRLQNDAQSIVTQRVNQVSGQYNLSDGALVSIDLRHDCYGCIRAMVGSAGYDNKAISGEINMADTPRQPGSSFKPFNYIKAFENGLSPATTVLDAPVAIPDQGNPEDGGWYEPANYDHLWHGTVSLRVALANSLNVPAVKVEQFNALRAGGDQGAIRRSIGQTAVDLGVASLFSDNPNCCGWSTTLGGMYRGVRLVEETAAYGAFATNGNKVTPTPVFIVRDRTTGKVLWDARHHFSYSQRVMPAPDAYLMNSVLSDNDSRCTPAVCEFGTDSPLNLGRTAAAKTGTTEGFTDNWTVGYTPDIVTGVWVGNANNARMAPNTTGVVGAAPIWHDFMLRAFAVYNLPPRDFPQPANVSYGSTCKAVGQYGVSYLSTAYDAYAGDVPLCAVGSGAPDSLPNPPQQSASEPPAQQTAPQSPAPAPAQPVAPAQPASPPQQPAAPAQPVQPPASNAAPAPARGSGTTPSQPSGPPVVQPAPGH